MSGSDTATGRRPPRTPPLGPGNFRGLSDNDRAMTDHSKGPLLFLDVDGTLISFGQHQQQAPLDTTSDSYLARLDPQTGTRPAALPCRLVWATTWENAANTEVAPRLGLPPLQVVHWLPGATRTRFAVTRSHRISATLIRPAVC